MNPDPFTGAPGCPGMCWVLRVSGEADLATAPDLAQALERIPPAARVVVVDLTGVTFMDCSVLAVLLRARSLHVGAFWLHGLQPPVVRLLEATGLRSTFVIDEVQAPCRAVTGLDAGLLARVAEEAVGVQRCAGVELRLGTSAAASDVRPHLASVSLSPPAVPLATPAPTPNSANVRWSDNAFIRRSEA